MREEHLGELIESGATHVGNVQIAELCVSNKLCDGDTEQWGIRYQILAQNAMGLGRNKAQYVVGRITGVKAQIFRHYR